MEVFLIVFFSMLAGCALVLFCNYLSDKNRLDVIQRRSDEEFIASQSQKIRQSELSKSKAYEFYSSGRDNFEIIAANISMFYFTLKRTNIGSKLNDRCAQLVATIFASSAYLNNGEIKEADLTEAIISSECNVVVLDHTVKRYDPLSCENSELVQLIMQIECLMLHADNPHISISDVLDCVVDQRFSIARSVNNTLTRGITHPLFDSFMLQTNCFISDPVGIKLIYTVTDLFEEDTDSSSSF